MRLDQFLPHLKPGDAIGDHARALRRLLRAQGIASEIFAEAMAPGMEAEALPLSAYRPSLQGHALLHFTNPSTASEAFFAARGRRALVYHNITPHHYFEGHAPESARACREARRELGKLASRVPLAIAVSRFNQQELDALGFRQTCLAPVLVDFEAHAGASPDPDVLARYGDGRVNLLMVGRLAPHKRGEDAIRAFARYHHGIEPRSRLLIVGSPRGLETYQAELLRLAAALGVLPHVHVCGHVPFAALVAYYRVADLLLSMSEHEGFCVPLLEAMHHGTPVLAYAAGAVSETLGAAGVRLLRKEPSIAAELIHLLVSDRALRERIIARQRERARDFAPAVAAACWQACLAPLLRR